MQEFPKETLIGDVISWLSDILIIDCFLNPLNLQMRLKNLLRGKHTASHLRFGVLTAVIMKYSVLWDITPHSPLKVNQRFGETFCLHLQDWNLPGRLKDWTALYPGRYNSSLDFYLRKLF
jgi:hypothetical protein